MKTAMKELTDYMKTYFHLTDESLEMFDKALEKEKEQIIHAHAHHRCVNDKTMECTIKAYENAEQYYNQTYKPETI